MEYPVSLAAQINETWQELKAKKRLEQNLLTETRETLQSLRGDHLIGVNM